MAEAIPNATPALSDRGQSQTEAEIASYRTPEGIQSTLSELEGVLRDLRDRTSHHLEALDSDHVFKLFIHRIPPCFADDKQHERALLLVKDLLEECTERLLPCFVDADTRSTAPAWTFRGDEVSKKTGNAMHKTLRSILSSLQIFLDEYEHGEYGGADSKAITARKEACGRVLLPLLARLVVLEETKKIAPHIRREVVDIMDRLAKGAKRNKRYLLSDEFGYPKIAGLVAEASDCAMLESTFNLVWSLFYRDASTTEHESSARKVFSSYHFATGDTDAFVEEWKASSPHITSLQNHTRKMILRLAATNIDRVQLFSVASVTLNASALALAMKGADKDGSFDMAVNQRSLSCWAETTDEWGLLEVELESIESLEVDEAAGGSQDLCTIVIKSRSPSTLQSRPTHAHGKVDLKSGKYLTTVQMKSSQVERFKKTIQARYTPLLKDQSFPKTSMTPSLMTHSESTADPAPATLAERPTASPALSLPRTSQAGPPPILRRESSGMEESAPQPSAEDRREEMRANVESSFSDGQTQSLDDAVETQDEETQLAENAAQDAILPTELAHPSIAEESAREGKDPDMAAQRETDTMKVEPAQNAASSAAERTLPPVSAAGSDKSARPPSKQRAVVEIAVKRKEATETQTQTKGSRRVPPVQTKETRPVSKDTRQKEPEKDSSEREVSYRSEKGAKAHRRPQAAEEEVVIQSSKAIITGAQPASRELASVSEQKLGTENQQSEGKRPSADSTGQPTSRISLDSASDDSELSDFDETAVIPSQQLKKQTGETGASVSKKPQGAKNLKRSVPDGVQPKTTTRVSEGSEQDEEHDGRAAKKAKTSEEYPIQQSKNFKTKEEKETKSSKKGRDSGFDDEMVEALPPAAKQKPPTAQAADIDMDDDDLDLPEVGVLALEPMTRTARQVASSTPKKDKSSSDHGEQRGKKQKKDTTAPWIRKQEGAADKKRSDRKTTSEGRGSSSRAQHDFRASKPESAVGDRGRSPKAAGDPIFPGGHSSKRERNVDPAERALERTKRKGDVRASKPARRSDAPSHYAASVASEMDEAEETRISDMFDELTAGMSSDGPGANDQRHLSLHEDVQTDMHYEPAMGLGLLPEDSFEAPPSSPGTNTFKSQDLYQSPPPEPVNVSDPIGVLSPARPAQAAAAHARDVSVTRDSLSPKRKRGQEESNNTTDRRGNQQRQVLEEVGDRQIGHHKPVTGKGKTKASSKYQQQAEVKEGRITRQGKRASEVSEERLSKQQDNARVTSAKVGGRAPDGPAGRENQRQQTKRKSDRQDAPVSSSDESMQTHERIPAEKNAPVSERRDDPHAPIMSEDAKLYEELLRRVGTVGLKSMLADVTTTEPAPAVRPAIGDTSTRGSMPTSVPKQRSDAAQAVPASEAQAQTIIPAKGARGSTATSRPHDRVATYTGRDMMVQAEKRARARMSDGLLPILQELSQLVVTHLDTRMDSYLTSFNDGLEEVRDNVASGLEDAAQMDRQLIGRLHAHNDNVQKSAMKTINAIQIVHDTNALELSRVGHDAKTAKELAGLYGSKWEGGLFSKIPSVEKARKGR